MKDVSSARICNIFEEQTRINSNSLVIHVKCTDAVQTTTQMPFVYSTSEANVIVAFTTVLCPKAIFTLELVTSLTFACSSTTRTDLYIATFT
jgi:hypothetical protein